MFRDNSCVWYELLVDISCFTAFDNVMHKITFFIKLHKWMKLPWQWWFRLMFLDSFISNLISQSERRDCRRLVQNLMLSKMFTMRFIQLRYQMEYNFLFLFPQLKKNKLNYTPKFVIFFNATLHLLHFSSSA